MKHVTSGQNLVRVIGPYIKGCENALGSVLLYTNVFKGLDKMVISAKKLDVIYLMYIYLL
jgi:hypothetical protein